MKTVLTLPLLVTRLTRSLRIEELTKNETIQNLVGMNGVIISDEALEKLSDTAIKNKFKTLNLGERKISIRSFPEVDRVHYRTADCLLKG